MNKSYAKEIKEEARKRHLHTLWVLILIKSILFRRCRSLVGELKMNIRKKGDFFFSLSIFPPRKDANLTSNNCYTFFE